MFFLYNIINIKTILLVSNKFGMLNIYSIKASNKVINPY